MPARDSGGYFYNLRGEVGVVAGTVKPLGDRAGEYSNTNTPDIDLVISERASPS